MMVMAPSRIASASSSRRAVGKLVLDLGHVPYMDSTCVGELVSAFITTRNQGGTLKFAGVSGRVATLFTISRLDTVFEVFETDTAALQSFSSA